ncbi:MAG: molybdopterin-dependent oxidoreductase Mo/Fe-S-binding subunit [Candidatus Sericytochromatia bacterium]|nr:molybdopterin-dependent oxidoreductase Mo/Fe-S-binding subunit [Candidatus Tanganyikabacteria bacterium]
MQIVFELDGREITLDVAPTARLREVLQAAGIRSVRSGCDGEGMCGACTVLVDGKPHNSCLLAAPQIHGRKIRTVEGISRTRELSPLQQAFLEAGLIQCGYCTPAFLLCAHDLLERVPQPTREDVRDAFSGTLCRCNGYEQLYQAISRAGGVVAASVPGSAPASAPGAPGAPAALRYVGRDAHKVDGPKLARGGAAFVEDRVPARACHLKVLGSPHAHAFIRRIDTARAEALPGVRLVLTHRNTPDVYYGSAGQGYPEPSPYDRRMFGEKVRHVGDRVAAVLADTPAIASEALRLIEVEYEVLEPVLSIEAAAAPGAPRVHAGAVEFVVGAPHDLPPVQDPREGRIIYQFPIHADIARNLAASVTGGIGDVAAGFAEADVILEREYEGGNVQCTPLEPHIVYTKMDGDRLIVHAATQVPFHVRRILARILGVPENRIRVIKEHTGGAFGAKQDMVLEEVAAYATWVTGLDVVYRFSREEEFTSRTRHPMRIKVKMGAKRDGRLTAVQMDVLANTGPYGGHCLTVPMNACSKALPLFLCDNVSFDVKSYYSNIAPTGAYQGYGAPKGSFAMQLMGAEMAERLGLDHFDFIEQNRVREGVVLEILRCLGEGREGKAEKILSSGLGPALEEGRKLIEWGTRVQSADPAVAVGKGMCIVQQGSGLPGLDSANAAIMMFGDGTFMLHSGGTDLGTGLDTVSVKMVAEVLQTRMSDVSIISADTDVSPFDVGAYASSGTYFSGGASLNAARKMKAMLLEAAAEMLAEPESNLELAFPSKVRGKSGEVGFDEIARHTQSGTGRGQLIATAHFIAEKGSFPYGAHFCQVAVDTRTGQVTVQKYYALQDCGVAINPEMALGQIYGGVLRAIGHSLFEELRYDATGKCVNPSFSGYHVPYIGDVPDDFRAILVETDDPFGPFGAKSVSEISVNGAAPAIASAIHDACGVWLRSWPFTPEKVLAALAAARGPDGAAPVVTHLEAASERVLH